MSLIVRHTRSGRVLPLIAALTLSAAPPALEAQGAVGITSQGAPTLPGPSAPSASDSALADAIRHSVAFSPRLRAARSRARAAEARVGPAGARSDPMLMAGVQNLPVTEPGFHDEMTMKMVGVSQTFSLGGKRTLARDAASRDASAARAFVTAESLAVVAAVKDAYYDLAFADRSLALLERSRALLADLVRATELRYRTGAVGGGSAVMSPLVGETAMSRAPTLTRAGSMPGATGTSSAMSAMGAPPRPSGGGMSAMGAPGVARSAPVASSPSSAPMANGSAIAAMPPTPTGPAMVGEGAMSGAPTTLRDVLAARQSLARLDEQAAAVREQRATALARLDALLGRSGETPFDGARIPDLLARAALGDTSRMLAATPWRGDRVGGSPIPPLSELERDAHEDSPELAVHQAAIAAQQARVELARRSRIPDVDVSIEYGQRDRMPDMVTARVSIPLQLSRGTRQDQYVAEAGADLTALEAEHEDRVQRLHAEVARLRAAAQRDRSQLALYVRTILPQGRAAADAALAAYRAGQTTLAAVLEARLALLDLETSYERTLTDFAKTLAALDQQLGREVVR